MRAGSGATEGAKRRPAKANGDDNRRQSATRAGPAFGGGMKDEWAVIESGWKATTEAAR